PANGNAGDVVPCNIIIGFVSSAATQNDSRRPIVINLAISDYVTVGSSRPIIDMNTGSAVFIDFGTIDDVVAGAYIHSVTTTGTAVVMNLDVVEFNVCSGNLFSSRRD